ncbi:MAG TPA: FtsX-like permease family protein, partial [Actinomycetota bacterium]|nr:FtsX-like permease family protein [Actinomycetota bacterium]
GLVVFTLVIIMVLGAMIDASADGTMADASGGFPIRADFNPSDPVGHPVTAFTTGRFAGRVETVVPLVVAPGLAAVGAIADADVVVVGADYGIVASGLYPLTERLPLAESDRAAWEMVLRNTRWAIVDQFIGQAGGGPPAVVYHPGDEVTLTDPATGRSETKVIAGILKASDGLRGIQNTGYTSPIVMGTRSAHELFGTLARRASALIKPAPGEPLAALQADLQGQFLANGLIVTDVRSVVERSLSATRGFFQLMEGFLALGLLVGIAGLGIVMVRAVRERRRTIGVLRALGFGARTVRRAFLGESAFVAFEGIVLGAGLGLVTSYLMFVNFPSFEGMGIGFPVPWTALAVVLVITGVASLLATMWPARRAANIRPAVALRIAD